MFADEKFPEFFRKKKDVTGALAQRRQLKRSLRKIYNHLPKGKILTIPLRIQVTHNTKPTLKSSETAIK